MQWDKVKNVLIVILMAVNVFLLGNLGRQFWQTRQQEAELVGSLRTLAQGYGISLDADFALPNDVVLPELSIDRSRPNEEAAAAAMLGGEPARTEQEDGTVLFEGERGTVEWGADGSVSGSILTGEAAPADESAALHLAKQLFSDWKLQAEDAVWAAEGTSVTMTGTVAGLPVFNRVLTIRFTGDGFASLSGLWSFGTPYTTVSASGVACNAADALLEFVARQPEAQSVLSMTAGYRMQTDSSRRIQLTPTWKIVTDSGEYLVDCDKKTIIDREN
nr:hypothetical protein [uncultured Agathobaculum sp.]